MEPISRNAHCNARVHRRCGHIRRCCLCSRSCGHIRSHRIALSDSGSISAEEAVGDGALCLDVCRGRSTRPRRPACLDDGIRHDHHVHLRRPGEAPAGPDRSQASRRRTSSRTSAAIRHQRSRAARPRTTRAAESKEARRELGEQVALECWRVLESSARASSRVVASESLSERVGG